MHEDSKENLQTLGPWFLSSLWVQSCTPQRYSPPLPVQQTRDFVSPR